MTAVVSGSIAFDSIMVFDGRFKEHILPDQIHILNVSFLVPQMRREFGGCAGNIAFNLAMLGGDVAPLGTVGSDAGPYLSWFQEHGIRCDAVRSFDETLTAQAFITTDLDDNQITAFHPGAMGEAAATSVGDVSGATIGIVAPNAKDAMLKHAKEFADAGIPFIFDPGQALSQYSGDELKQCIDLATWMTVNDYEWRMTADRTGWDTSAVAGRVDALIVTQGGEGSVIYTGDGDMHVDPVAPADVVDPTGCGDAYRAGILYGLMHEYDWQRTGAIASFMGSLKISHRGTQNHYRSKAQLESEFAAATGLSL